MKTNSTFKLPRSLKQILSTIDNVKQRGDTKRLFIQAESTYLENKNRRSKEKINLGDE